MDKRVSRRKAAAKRPPKSWKIAGTSDWRNNNIMVLYKKLISDRMLWPSCMYDALWHISSVINDKIGTHRWISPNDMYLVRQTAAMFVILVGKLKIVIEFLKNPIEITFHNLAAFIVADRHLVDPVSTKHTKRVLYTCNRGACIKYFDPPGRLITYETADLSPDQSDTIVAPLMSSVFKSHAVRHIVPSTPAQTPMTPEQPPMTPRQPEMPQMEEIEWELPDDYSSYLIDYYASSPFSKSFAASQ